MRLPSRLFILIAGLLILFAGAAPLVSADDAELFWADSPGHIQAMQERLDNLAAQGVDVSAQQEILSQITSLSQQVQTAAENHDEAAVRDLNDQIITLNRQFLDAYRDATKGSRR